MNPLAVELEPISARGWPPRVVQSLGGWRLHAARGFSGRANACWPLGAPDRPLDEAIGAVEAWYAARGLPPLFRPADIDETLPLRAALEASGYAAGKETLVMTGPLPRGDAAQARIETAPDAAFAQVFAATAVSPGDAAERIDAITRLAAPRAFARIERDGAPAAIGIAAVDSGWAGVFGMRTLVEHRRQGLALGILAALGDFARQAGARRAYLQVETRNAPAVSLYERLGFETAYRYRYWSRG